MCQGCWGCRATSTDQSRLGWVVLRQVKGGPVSRKSGERRLRAVSRERLERETRLGRLVEFVASRRRRSSWGGPSRRALRVPPGGRALGAPAAPGGRRRSSVGERG